MRHVLLIGVCFLCAVVGGYAQADESKPIEIPLGEIWAVRSAHQNMPETRDLLELDPPGRKSLWDPIAAALEKASPYALREGQKALPGFAVSGAGRDAFRGAHDVLVEGKDAREVFTTNDEITLVFFTHPSSGAYVQLIGVQREGNAIKIMYQLKPYLERNLSQTFALIPVSKLPKGRYRVEMTPLPMEKKFVEWGLKAPGEEFLEKILCQPFEFQVIASN